MSKFYQTSQERLFNLDSMERSNWRNRINQLKRELRSPSDRVLSQSPSSSTSARPSLRRSTR